MSHDDNMTVCTDAAKYNLFDLIEHSAVKSRSNDLLRRVEYRIRVRSIENRKESKFLDEIVEINGMKDDIIGSTIEPWIESSSDENILIVYVSFETRVDDGVTRLHNSLNILKKTNNDYHNIYSDTYESDTAGKFMAIDKSCDKIYNIYNKKLGEVGIDFDGKNTSLEFNHRSGRIIDSKSIISRVYLLVKSHTIGLAINSGPMRLYLSTDYSSSNDLSVLRLLARSKIDKVEPALFEFQTDLKTAVIATQSSSELNLEFFKKSHKGDMKRVDCKTYATVPCRPTRSIRPFSLDIKAYNNHYICSYVSSDGSAFYVYRKPQIRAEWYRTKVQVNNKYHNSIFVHSTVHGSRIIYSYAQNKPKHSVIIVPDLKDCDSSSDSRSSNTDSYHDLRWKWLLHLVVEKLFFITVCIAIGILCYCFPQVFNIFYYAFYVIYYALSLVFWILSYVLYMLYACLSKLFGF